VDDTLVTETADIQEHTMGMYLYYYTTLSISSLCLILTLTSLDSVVEAAQKDGIPFKRKGSRFRKRSSGESFRQSMVSFSDDSPTEAKNIVTQTVSSPTTANNTASKFDIDNTDSVVLSSAPRTGVEMVQATRLTIRGKITDK
jgi:hypothetical protein